MQRGWGPGSFVHGIFLAGVLEWGAIALSGFIGQVSSIEDYPYVSLGFPGGAVVRNPPIQETHLKREWGGAGRRGRG